MADGGDGEEENEPGEVELARRARPDSAGMFRRSGSVSVARRIVGVLPAYRTKAAGRLSQAGATDPSPSDRTPNRRSADSWPVIRYLIRLGTSRAPVTGSADDVAAARWLCHAKRPLLPPAPTLAAAAAAMSTDPLRAPTAVSAPGKVLLAGGYLVLDRRHTGLVVGLDARIHVLVEPIRTKAGVALSEIIVRSPQFRDARWEYGYRVRERAAGVDVTQLSV